MTAHKLAEKLLEMPDETVFVQSRENESLWTVKDVELCTCKCEIVITQENF